MNKEYTYDFINAFNQYEIGGKLSQKINEGELNVVYREFRNLLVHSQLIIYDQFDDSELENILRDVCEGTTSISISTYNKIAHLTFDLLVRRFEHHKDFRMYGNYKKTTRTKTVYLKGYDFERIGSSFPDNMFPIIIRVRSLYQPSLEVSEQIPTDHKLINISQCYPESTDVVSVTGKWYVTSEVNEETKCIFVTFFKNTHEVFPLKFEVYTSLDSDESQFNFPWATLDIPYKVSSMKDVVKEFGPYTKKIIRHIRSTYRIILSDITHLV